MRNYLVVGAGVSGLTAAFELAEQGNEVTVLESDSAVGGKVLSYCCKATDECSRCGVCVAHTQIHSSIQHPRIRIITGAEIISVVNRGGKITAQVNRLNPSLDVKKCIWCDACISACPEGCIGKYSRGELIQYRIDFKKCRIHRGQHCLECAEVCPSKAVFVQSESTRLTFSADGALITIGHEPYDAERKIRFGYRRHRKVITGLEAEEILSLRSYLYNPGERVAFIQCVGSRDPQIGRNYCSSVCCAYAMRLAQMLQYKNKDAEIAIYYIDLQNFDKTFTAFRKNLVKGGVHLIRGIPFRIDETSQGTLRLLTENTANGGEDKAEYDVVVLSVGLGPSAGAPHIAGLFGLESDEFGFLSSKKENVFLSGTCNEPMSIPECMLSARAVVLEMGKLRS
ncbi:MAG: FAD-dependent oxidoreductase [Spirochaetota bacterium]